MMIDDLVIKNTKAVIMFYLSYSSMELVSNFTNISAAKYP